MNVRIDPSPRVDGERHRTVGGARGRWLCVAAVALALQTGPWKATPAADQDFVTAAGLRPNRPGLVPTAHPPVPPALDDMWYAPPKTAGRLPAPIMELARGVKLLEESGDPATALPLVSASALKNTDVADDAQYYTGVALRRLNRLEEADAAFGPVAGRSIKGALPEIAAFAQAEAKEARGDFAGAVKVYEGLLEREIFAPQRAWLGIAAAAETMDRTKALDAYRRILREAPLSPEAARAEVALDRLGGFVLTTPEAVADELARAEILFKARRWPAAQDAFARVRGRVGDAQRDLVEVRLAEIGAMSGQHRAARDVLRRYTGHDILGEEARFHLLAALRGLKEKDEYRNAARSFIETSPASFYAEEALNDLAVHYVLENDDEAAAKVFREIVERFPSGRFAERAAWKAGWWAYRQDDYAETVRLFEIGATNFPRSDYRPPWLYWSGRAYDGLGKRDAATERYRLTATDYLNTYYGRLAWKELEARDEARVAPGLRRGIAPPPPPPPTMERIAQLIQWELYHPALAELQYAQTMWGDSTPLRATIGLVYHRLGQLRPGITAMKRAYPQFMTAGGESLPVEVLRVMFPVDYWPLLQYHARAHGLDPYVVAALVAQESTFDASIVSSANAIGLMQVLPSTGRQYARTLGIKPFSAERLTEPEVNVRIGMQYFANLVKMFDGGVHYALASYNAGEHRVIRWKREKPDLPQDEFIDDIPFPETQNYVKRILGTAEDYRRLYGAGYEVPTVARPKPTKYVAGSAAKKSSGKKASAKKSTKKAAGKKSTMKKSSAKKSPAKKSTATKSRARKSTAQR